MIDNLGISDFDFRENSYTRYGKEYAVVDLQIKGIDLGVNPWGGVNIKSFAYHVMRMNKADLKHPIIIDDAGYICDGWHRLAKAIINGDETIKAIRLTIMPEPIK